MKEFFSVFFGGAIGSVARFYLGAFVQSVLGQSFPWGILLVNVSGSFVIGIFSIIFLQLFKIAPIFRLLLITGFLGGYTTFSGFSLDVVNMFKYGLNIQAILYVFASVVLCLLATWLGMSLGELLIKV